TAATSFYLLVGAISTNLDVSGFELPDELYFNQTYTFSLFYSYGDSEGIEGATVNITYNPVAKIDWADSGNGLYQFSIRVPSVGSYAIYLRFQQYGYAFADTSFTFHVLEIPTTIIANDLDESYYESRTYDFALFYNSSLENGILGAELTPTSSIRDFYRLTGSSNGWYNFSLTPIEGDWNVTLWLTKNGYQEQEFSFSFHVVKIPIFLSPNYSLNQTYTRLEGSILYLELSPIAADTTLPVSDATVEFAIFNANDNGYGLISQGSFIETLGVYSVNITVPEHGLYLIQITISRSHYQTLQQEIVLSAEPDPASLIAGTFAASLFGALVLLAIISVTMISRRLYTTTSTKRNLELLALKGRLEDARNVIGLLIIHRKVGLPVYSRIIKGGFEESMLSSFIAAISQFRAEFSWDEPIWAAIPITEVITAVQTEVLICALITVESSSVRQKGQLEAFGREVGGLYDHEDDTLRAMFHTPELSEAFARTFDPIFDSYFEGALMARYVGVKKNIPSDLKPVAEVMSSLNIDHGVTLEAIIKGLVINGYGERSAYKLALDAIDGNYLIAGERKLPPPGDLL
ncbi:MAG: hypothetical protein ACFFEA_14805, partial [Candidatus Thorarchaeota archaeon]